jgi:hypothetical protein
LFILILHTIYLISMWLFIVYVRYNMFIILNWVTLWFALHIHFIIALHVCVLGDIVPLVIFGLYFVALCSFLFWTFCIALFVCMLSKTIHCIAAPYSHWFCYVVLYFDYIYILYYMLFFFDYCIVFYMFYTSHRIALYCIA